MANLIQTYFTYTPILKIPVYIGYYHNKVAFIELGEPNCGRVAEAAMIKSMERKFPGYFFKNNANIFKDINKDIIDMIDTSNANNINIPIINLVGTSFQFQVWNALKNIPRGKTKTYAEIAETMGIPNSFRAVASAIGKNNHAVIIPCHRVLPKAGGIGKYKWGSDLKQKFLEIEQND